MPQGSHLIGRQFEVENGPGVTGLEHGMFYRHQGVPRHEVSMKAKGLGTVTFILSIIGEEDGGTDNWLFYGRVCKSSLAGMKVEGYFNSTRRTGWLRFTDGPPTIFG